MNRPSPLISTRRKSHDFYDLTKEEPTSKIQSLYSWKNFINPEINQIYNLMMKNKSGISSINKQHSKFLKKDKMAWSMTQLNI